VKNTADVTGGKPIAVLLQCISGVTAINPLVAIYDIHGRKGEVLFYFVPDTTRDDNTKLKIMEEIRRINMFLHFAWISQKATTKREYNSINTRDRLR
jgi:hypothetical protein